MQTVDWHIRALATPEIIRHCKTCGMKRPFVSSGLFRVNANHHTLDIWLIHRCVHCGRTWNLEIHERVRPHDLPLPLLEGYQINDPDLAWRCAHDTALLSRAGAVVDYTHTPLAIDGPYLALPLPGEIVTLALMCGHPLDVRLSRILREGLGLSASQFKRLAESGRIACPGMDVQKARFISGMRVVIGGDPTL